MNREQVASFIKMLKHDTDVRSQNDLGEVLAYLFNRVNALPRTTLTFNEIQALTQVKEMLNAGDATSVTLYANGNVVVDRQSGYEILNYVSLEDFMLGES